MSNKCPYCISTVCRHILDRQLQRELDALEVRCFGYEFGCVWVGKLRSLSDHHRQCSFMFIKCQHCLKPIPRHEVTKHENSECPRRKIKCDDCGQMCYYGEITFHQKVCTAKVYCPNLCGEKTDKHLLQMHRVVCPQEVIQCPYAEFGCLTRPTRGTLQEHVTSCSQQYTLKLLRELRNSQKQVEAMRQELAVLKASMAAAASSIVRSVDTLCSSANEQQAKCQKSIRGQIATLNYQHLNNSNKMISLLIQKPQNQTSTSSRAFYIFDGYRMRLMLTHDDSQLKFQLKLVLEDGALDNSLKWPLEKHAELVMSVGEHQAPFSLAHRGLLTSKINRVIEQFGKYVCVWKDSFSDAYWQGKTFHVKLYCDQPTAPSPIHPLSAGLHCDSGVTRRPVARARRRKK